VTKRILQLCGCVSLLVVFAACPHPISQEEFDALEEKVDVHRQQSQQWAEAIHERVVALVDCHYNAATCDPPDPTTPPPPNGGW
jgi:hypothetical protein